MKILTNASSERANFSAQAMFEVSVSLSKGFVLVASNCQLYKRVLGLCEAKAKIIIQDNIIQNNHEIGIEVQGQASMDESNNIISKIKTKGRKGIATPTIDLNYRGYNK